MEKHCKVCGELKPLEEFYRSAGMRDGHRNDCKACNLAAKARRYAADPQAAIDRVSRWQKANPERMRAYRKEYRQREHVKKSQREGHLRRKFGLTSDQYDEMLAAQGGRCAICRRPPTQGISLHVDHDHVTGTNRKLLCFKCNNALGDFEDDPQLLQAAIAYLDDHDPEVQELAELTRRRLAGLIA